MFIGNRCSHAPIKGGWLGQMRFKMAGKFKSKQASSSRGSVYNGRNALAKHIYTERSERTQPSETRKCRRMLLTPHTLRKTRVPDGRRKWIASPRDRNEIEARKIIDKHAQKVYNYVYTKWQAETPWPLGRRSWCGQLCWFSFYSIAYCVQKSRVVDQTATRRP